MLACFVLWVVLFFGRASLGSLIDLLPMSSGIHMSRFISGVQIFGLILAGLGLSTLIRWISKLRWVWALAAGGLLVVVMAIPVSKRITFICQSDFWAISAKQGYDAALGFRDVVQHLEASSQARIHAGFPKTWGNELKIGGVPVYSLLQGAGFDMVGYLFLAQLHPEEWQFYLEPGRQEHCDLYNIRHLLMPASRTPPAFAQERSRRGNLVLYEVPTSGYFGLGSVADPSESKLLVDSLHSLDWEEIYRIGDSWLQGPGPAEGSYLAYGNRAATEPFGGRQGVLTNQMNAPGRYSAEVKAESEVGVILKVTYHPYWRATVDGVPTALTRVFPGFMAIRLDPGTHQVSFEYRAPAWKKLLAMLPPLLWLFTLGSFGLRRWRRRWSSAEGTKR